MNFDLKLSWGFHHIFIDPRRWQREHETAFWLREYELLDIWHAESVLDQVARKDEAFLHRLGRELLHDYGLVNPARGGYRRDASARERLLRGLKRKLGFGHQPGKPMDPRFAGLLVCRRKAWAPAWIEPLPDPSKEVREVIEAAQRAPRGFVIVETVNEAGKPIPHVRLEILLGDGQVLTRATGSNGQLRLDPVPQGRCTVRLPHLDGSSWHPAEGSASSRVDKGHKRLHVVAKGDNLTRIAQQYGIKGWKKLWDAPDNEPLRKKRKSPHVLYPGDEVVIPSIEIHEIVRPTDQIHRIILTEALVEFRVVLQDHNQLPYKQEPYELRLTSAPGETPRQGETDDDGKIIEQLQANTGRVEVFLPKPSLRWAFAIGELLPIPDEKSLQEDSDPSTPELMIKAVQTRLLALGFPCGEVDGKVGPLTRAALALWQGEQARTQQGPADDSAQPLLDDHFDDVMLAALDDAYEVVA